MSPKRVSLKIGTLKGMVFPVDFLETNPGCDLKTSTQMEEPEWPRTVEKESIRVDSPPHEEQSPKWEIVPVEEDMLLHCQI